MPPHRVWKGELFEVDLIRVMQICTWFSLTVMYIEV
jgi:hypothetical protein